MINTPMKSAYDSILVLGCGIDEKGLLNEDAKACVSLAVNLYKNGRASTVITSGYVSYKADFVPPISEAQAMKEFAISLGVPSNKIFTEVESQDTLGQAYFIKKNLLEPLEFRKVFIVRGPNHTSERIQYIFSKVLGSEYEFEIIETEKERPKEQERERKSLKVLKNWIDNTEDGDDQAIYKIMRLKHPAYSSNPEADQDLKQQLAEA